MLHQRHAAAKVERPRRDRWSWDCGKSSQVAAMMLRPHNLKKELNVSTQEKRYMTPIRSDKNLNNQAIDVRKE
jgi:hypothetical protein